jgi:hypothetical protein
MMRQRPWWGAAALLAPLLGAFAGVVAAGADSPAARDPGADRLPADAARMYGFVTTPHPGELQWQQIPWLTDLQEAVRQAKAERRPLVLFVSGDDPLEKC